MLIIRAVPAKGPSVESRLNQMLSRLAVFTLLTGMIALIACGDSPTGPTTNALTNPAVDQATGVVPGQFPPPSTAGGGASTPINGLSPTESLLTLTVIDPTGDNTGHIDLLGMEMDFNPATGDYEIRLEADPASPFSAAFRVNINLFNVDDATFFSDNLNDFGLVVSTTSLALSGNSSHVTSWEEGDNVFTNSLCSRGPSQDFSCSTFDVPNPTGVSLFRSAVSSFPSGFLTNEDVIAFSDYARSAVVEELTAQVRVGRLASDVRSLVDAGVISEDQADGLLEKLDEVLTKIDAGRTRAATNQLGAFINQVSSFVPNSLSPAQGKELIEQVEAVLAQLRH